MDYKKLALAFIRSNRRPAIAGALGFVGAVAIIDALAARGLDGETGRTFPRPQRRVA
jgi:hypothetical protein